MKITLRTDSIEVEGYVNAVGRDSRMLMDENGYSFREQIDPGTFAKALRAKAAAQQEISLLLDHNQGRVLGGTGSNLMLDRAYGQSYHHRSGSAREGMKPSVTWLVLRFPEAGQQGGVHEYLSPDHRHGDGSG